MHVISNKSQAVPSIDLMLITVEKNSLGVVVAIGIRILSALPGRISSLPQALSLRLQNRNPESLLSKKYLL